MLIDIENLHPNWAFVGIQGTTIRFNLFHHLDNPSICNPETSCIRQAIYIGERTMFSTSVSFNLHLPVHGCFIDDFEGGVNVSSNIFYRVLTGMTAVLLLVVSIWSLGLGGKTRVARERLPSHTRPACFPTTAAAVSNKILIAALAQSCRFDCACWLEQASSRTAVVTLYTRTTCSLISAPPFVRVEALTSEVSSRHCGMVSTLCLSLVRCGATAFQSLTSAFRRGKTEHRLRWEQLTLGTTSTLAMSP